MVVLWAWIVSLENYLGSELHLQSLAEHRCCMFSKGQMWTAQEGCLEGCPPGRERLPEAMRLRGHPKWPVKEISPTSRDL